MCGQQAVDGRVRLLAQVMEDAVEGIAQLGGDGRYVGVNAAYAAPLGRTPSDLVGLSWEVTVHPDDLPRVRDGYRQMLATGKGEAEARGVAADGGVFHTHVTMVAIRGTAGATEGSFCFVKNVTDRRRADDELRRSRELLTSVLDSSLDGVVACRAVRDRDRPERVVDFEYQLVNATAEQIIGRRAVDLLGRRMLTEFPGNVETGLFDKYTRVVTDRHAVRRRAALRPRRALVLAAHRGRADRGRRAGDHVRRHQRPQGGRGRGRPAHGRDRCVAAASADLQTVALDALDGGFWTLDLATRAFETSRGLAEKIAGPGHVSLNLAEYVSYIHADDLSVDLPDGEHDMTVEFRIFTYDGRMRWFQTRRAPSMTRRDARRMSSASCSTSPSASSR